MKTILIAIASYCMLLNACDGVIDPKPKPKDKQILPLSVGNWWQYTTALSSNSNAYIEWKITGTQKFNNNEYYVLTKTPYNSMGTLEADTSYLRYESDDVMTYSIEKGTESVLFDAPFNVVLYDSIMPYQGHFVVSNTCREEVPAGIFENCLDFVDNYPYHSDPSHDVLAYGVGYVRMWGFKWSYELKAYYVN
ncbi:MAG: hypothetical protein HYZ54_08410 [Ignavibacteriae bacterium]|nr:hypothetical protein [Ignavibacteriota bacterium]